MPQGQDIDLFHVPAEGVAAFWLALKKVVGSGKNFKPLTQEAEYTSDPFVRHLLDISFGNLDESRLRILAQAKAKAIINHMGRQFNLMRICLLDMLNLENPHRTLAKMMAQFMIPPVQGVKVFKLGQAMLRLNPADEKAKPHFNVTDHMPDENLVTVLIFYNLLVRHRDKMACQDYFPVISSRFFRDGLALIIDGFEEPFVRRWLSVHRQIALSDATHKMQMSTELCLAIRARYDYEDIERVAHSFL